MPEEKTYTYDEFRREFYPAVGNCPECGGTGEKVIGCAMFKALTMPCFKCSGTGRVPELPDSHPKSEGLTT